MNPELNLEYPEPGEVALIEKMVKLAVERMKPPSRVASAAASIPKRQVVVRGEFTIRNDIADDLRYGIFQKPNQVFQAIIRFSNSSETINPDGMRGLAIKLLDVAGTPAIKEAAVEVTVASPARGNIKGKRGYEVSVDKTLDEVNPDDYAILILLGGQHRQW